MSIYCIWCEMVQRPCEGKSKTKEKKVDRKKAKSQWQWCWCRGTTVPLIIWCVLSKLFHFWFIRHRRAHCNQHRKKCFCKQLSSPCGKCLHLSWFRCWCFVCFFFLLSMYFRTGFCKTNSNWVSRWNAHIHNLQMSFRSTFKILPIIWLCNYSERWVRVTLTKSHCCSTAVSLEVLICDVIKWIIVLFYLLLLCVACVAAAIFCCW